MNWLERYVAAVKRHLPSSTRDDIGEEIAATLREKLDDKAEAKGTELTDEEVLAVLKDYGHPMIVASRYSEHQSLIGEPFFPLYKQAIKYLLIVAFAGYVVSTLVESSGVFEWWPAGLNNWIEGITVWYAVGVTVAFHLLDRTLMRVSFFERWNPRRLRPAEIGARPAPIFDSVVSIMVSIAIFGILCGIHNEYSWELLIGRAENPWYSIVLQAKLYIAISIAIHLSVLYHAYWTRMRLVAKALAGLFLAFVSYRASVTFGAGFDLGPDANAEFLLWVNRAIRWTIWLILLSGVGDAVVNFYRVWKIRVK